MDPLLIYILGVITGVLAVCGVSVLMLRHILSEDPSVTSERDSRGQ